MCVVVVVVVVVGWMGGLEVECECAEGGLRRRKRMGGGGRRWLLLLLLGDADANTLGFAVFGAEAGVFRVLGVDDLVFLRRGGRGEDEICDLVEVVEIRVEALVRGDGRVVEGRELWEAGDGQEAGFRVRGRERGLSRLERFEEGEDGGDRGEGGEVGEMGGG